jgi:hypothetical protein
MDPGYKFRAFGGAVIFVGFNLGIIGKINNLPNLIIIFT